MDCECTLENSLRWFYLYSIILMTLSTKHECDQDFLGGIDDLYTYIL